MKMKDRYYRLQFTNHIMQITEKETICGEVANAGGKQNGEPLEGRKAITGWGCQPPLPSGG
jgi:hypothetical protein